MASCGLPDPLTTGALERIGVTASMGPRSLQTLRFLGLIDEGGNRLDAFEQLRRAKTEEFAATFAEIIRAAYLPVFTIVDPGTDSDTAIADAFRGYEPAAQRDKMITLFRGLCVRAEIIAAGSKASGGAPKKAVGGNATPRPKVAPKKPAAKDAGSAAAERAGDVRQAEDSAGVDIRLITAIIQQLPRERRWSQGRRERWLAAITSAVDLLIEVGDDAP